MSTAPQESAANLRHWKVTVQYDGSDYQGWQIQPDVPTVQAFIQRELSTIYNCQVFIHGSGRTDAGVHALGQVFSYTEPRPHRITPQALPRALNGRLPESIRVRCAELVDEDFHARFSPKGKTYVYAIDRSRINTPFLRHVSWNRRHTLDLEKMRLAAAELCGRHDFTAFTVNPGGLKGRCAIREIYDISLEEWDNFLLISFTGGGFLYKMVRALTGQLVEIGDGRAPVCKIPELLKSGDRDKAATVAPPQGLFLGEVYYSDTDLQSGLQRAPSTLLKQYFFGID